MDPQARGLLDFLDSLKGAPIHKLTPEKNRKGMHYIAGKTSMPPQPVADVVDRMIPVKDGEIKLRIYSPEGKGPFPIFVFFHGGGWIMGDVEVVDAPLRAVTNYAGIIVVSVDYRLAPEHKFPTAVYDSYEAVKWVAENARSLGGDSERIAVGGESAGGNLAAVTALIARDRGTPPLNYQVLLYPVTDCSREYPSQRKFDGYFITLDGMRYFEHHYLRSEEDRKDPYASPLLAEDLGNLPPALLVTAGYDPLHDEGKAYAGRLRESGVEVDYYCYEGMVHGFLGFCGRLDKGKELLELVSKHLREKLLVWDVE